MEKWVMVNTDKLGLRHFVFFLIIQVIIIIIEVFVCCLVIGLNIPKVNGPMHLPTIVNIDDWLIINDKGYKVYKQKVYSLDGQFISMSINDVEFSNKVQLNNEIVSYDYYGSNIYLATINGLVILDERLKMIDKVSILNMTGIVIKNNKIYCAHKNDDGDYSLIVLDLLSKEYIESIKISINNIYSDYGLFTDSSCNLYNLDSPKFKLQNNLDINFSYENQKKRIQFISIDNRMIIDGVEIKDFSGVEGDKLINNFSYYDDSLFFCTCNINDGDCGFDCICRYSNYQVWKFDFKRNELIEIEKLNDGSYFLGFYQDTYRHYYSNNLYINNCIIDSCVDLTPKGEFYYIDHYYGVRCDILYDENCFYVYYNPSSRLI